MKPDNKKISNYKNIALFEGLNPLRFIAAILVVIHHSETIKKKNGMDNLEWLGLFRNGNNAVTFFFVLSGFLITYLLLKEHDKTSNISIKTFYFKRIVRIWPLYFLLVFIGTIGLPLAFSIVKIAYKMPYNLAQTWYYFLFFMPGLVTFYFGHHFLEPLWSIGVEEVFYLIWAPLFKLNKNKILNLLLSVFILKSIFNFLGIYVIDNELFNHINNIFKFEAMAIGGLGAYFLFTKGHLITQHYLFKIAFQYIIFAVLLFYLTFHSNINNPYWNAVFKTPLLSAILIDVFFLYIIICISSVDNSIIKLKNKSLSYLGEISYGIYMYHMFVIFGTVLFLKKYFIQIYSPWNHVIFYTIIIIFTLLVSAISKHYFENYFLNFKNRLNTTPSNKIGLQKTL